jgi:hypothetical protein
MRINQLVVLPDKRYGYLDAITVTKDKILKVIKGHRRGDLMVILTKHNIFLNNHEDIKYLLDIDDPFFFDHIVLPTLNLKTVPTNGIDWRAGEPNVFNSSVYINRMKSGLLTPPASNLNGLIQSILRQL